MKMIPHGVASLFGIALTASLVLAAPGRGEAEIRISDVELFYRVYDAAGSAPSAEVLQHDYLDAGSDGVRQFVPHRILSAEALATAIANKHSLYEKARACAAELPAVRSRVSAALAKLGDLRPTAEFPPVTVLVGRGNAGGTTDKAGVLIGLETICNAEWLQPNLEDRLVHLIAHEYAHIQQPIVERLDDPNDGTHTVLEVSLVEGVADFVAELISGSASNVHLQRWTAGREEEIAAAFLKDTDSTDLKDWLYDGVGTPQRPGDLGYWVGYRIAKCFYAHSADPKTAVRQLVELEDPKRILAQSGWPDGKDGSSCSP